MLDMSVVDYSWAIANDQGDFEDALPVSCVLRHGCSKWLAFNIGMNRHQKHIPPRLI